MSDPTESRRGTLWVGTMVALTVVGGQVVHHLEALA